MGVEMRIRSVTIGTNLGYPLRDDHFASLDAFPAQAQALFAKAGFEVQTVRLASQPFPEVVASSGPSAAVQYGCQLEARCRAIGIDYCSLGSVQAVEQDADLRYVDVIPEIIRQTGSAFVSVLVADRQCGVHLEAIQRVAEVISQVAEIEEGGFGNLRLAVLANCGPGSPFFPASYHRGEGTTFSIATESADLAVEAFDGAADVAQARDRLRLAVERTAHAIEEVSAELAAESGMQFRGIDFSLAPYPEMARSIGSAIERLGVSAFGSSGTLFAVALMTRVLREARYQRCGFSGIMLPVLEDQVLAQRSGEGLYGLDSLLLYSAVCGTGLDTVPLPGDVSVDELAAILLDVSTLALVADKPLTARLMPIPGKQAGDLTDFSFGYFANGRVLAVRDRGARAILASGGCVPL
jgi:uncharacterized protein (UPF0210 family)